MDSYSKILQRSNFYYNEGLERAQVHNISGAIEALGKSLTYNKRNVDARNLLGLCYYEIGEVVSALREWVISDNIKPEDNLAKQYVEQIKPEMARTGKYNQCIKKYNLALGYANSDSGDLAIIQLKKVCSTNPKYLRAHQLLALLYLKEEQYSQARDVLRKINKVDAGNTTTLLYLKEANEALKNADTGKKSKKKNIAEDSVEYISGNATVIRPAYFRDNATIGVVVNILFGILLGFLISYFLVVPGVKRQASADSAAKLVEANETISTKNVTIKELQAKIDDLNSQLESEQNANTKTESTVNFYQELLATYVYFNDGEYEKAGEALASIDKNSVTEEFKEVYDSLSAQVNAKYLRILYSRGSSAYNQGSYDKAIEIFESIIKIDASFDDGNALYFCAQAYRKLGDNQKAAVYYQKVIDEYPDTSRARNAQNYLEQITN